MQHGIHQLEVPTLLKVALSAEGHVLDLLLLFADRCKVVKDDFKLPLVSEGSKFLYGLSLIGSLLIADPPLGERVLEYADALFLQNPHHLGLDVCLRLLGVMIVNQGLISRGANLGIIERICIPIFPLLEGVHHKGSHDLHMCPIPIEN